MLWASFALTAAIDWWSVATGRPSVEQWFKPLTLTFLLAVTATGSFEPPMVQPLLLAGLAFGLVGDVLLLKTVDQFRAGLAAFLVGHLAYIAALATAGPKSTIWLLGGAATAIAVLAAARVQQLVNGVRQHQPSMVSPVLAYIGVIAAMVTLALASGRALTAVGALLFAGSDRLLAEDRFIRPIPQTRWLVHLFYHLGQAAIVAGLMT